MRLERFGGATGGMVEKELFGQSGYESTEHLDFSDYKYITRGTSFNVLKGMQPFEPTDPEPDFANTVHYYVYEGLGLDAENVKFYTAVKSPLDKFHGIDGWFEIDKDGRLRRVTVDITMNDHKDEYKADVVFLIPNGGLDRKVDKEQFIEYSNSLAEKVIEFLKKN